jgi:hypothetical protein
MIVTKRRTWVLPAVIIVAAVVMSMALGALVVVLANRPGGWL